MRSPYSSSRAMAMTIALASMDDEIRRAHPRAGIRVRRRVRRTRDADADGARE
jgi:hypothetical protein